jgi:hypothetical protein
LSESLLELKSQNAAMTASRDFFLLGWRRAVVEVVITASSNEVIYPSSEA